eukprot:GHVT01049141.1.p1 GENE.GHVT01049141.1~~GHVT01049141.1.p1  ORF type:complete len:992 (-),score=56.21 GHVT01049141.1:4490-7042(-)
MTETLLQKSFNPKLLRHITELEQCVSTFHNLFSTLQSLKHISISSQLDDHDSKFEANSCRLAYLLMVRKLLNLTTVAGAVLQTNPGLKTLRMAEEVEQVCTALTQVMTFSCGSVDRSNRQVVHSHAVVVGSKRLLTILRYSTEACVDALRDHLNATGLGSPSAFNLKTSECVDDYTGPTIDECLHPTYREEMTSRQSDIIKLLAAIFLAQKLHARAAHMLGQDAVENTHHSAFALNHTSWKAATSNSLIPIKELQIFQHTTAKMVIAFRHHFRRPVSPLCRIDHVEWACQYLLDGMISHSVVMRHLWHVPVSDSGEFQNAAEHPEQTIQLGKDHAYLLRHIVELRSHFDPTEGIGFQLAEEMRSLVRERMPALLFATTESSITTGQDQLPHDPPPVTGDDSDNNDDNSQSKASDDELSKIRSEAVDTLFLTTLGHLIAFHRKWKTISPKSVCIILMDFDLNTKVEPPGVIRRLAVGPLADNETEPAVNVGMLDRWMELDRMFLVAKLRTEAANGALTRRHGGAFSGARTSSGLCNTVIALLEICAERNDCLSIESSKANFAETVMGGALDKYYEVLRDGWNVLDDPLEELDETAMILESCLDVVAFVSGDFRYGPYVSSNVKALAGLSDRMIRVIVEILKEKVHAARRGMWTTGDAFDRALRQPLSGLARRVASATMRMIAVRIGADVEQMVLSHLLAHSTSSEKKDGLDFLVCNCENALSLLTEFGQLQEMDTPPALKEVVRLLNMSTEAATEERRRAEQFTADSSATGTITFAPFAAFERLADELLGGDHDLMGLHNISKPTWKYPVVGSKTHGLSSSEVSRILQKRPDMHSKVPVSLSDRMFPSSRS